jgi:hypothetical protein
MRILDRDLGGGSSHHLHNHGLFAGLSAAVTGILTVAGLALLLARQAMSTALGDAVWLIFAVLTAGAIGGIVLWYRLIWHKHLMYSAAVPVRAEVVRDDPPAITDRTAPAIGTAAGQVPELSPARELHVHLPDGMDPRDVAAVLAQLRAGHDPEISS